MDTLTLRYERDPEDDFGRLWVTVNASGFSGEGSMFVQWQDVEAFGAELTAFPLPRPGPALRRGFNQQIGDDLQVAIAIGPLDARGTLQVDVEVADYIEPTRRVRTSFHTHYPQVEAFQRAILRMLKGQIEDATLSGG